MSSDPTVQTEPLGEDFKRQRQGSMRAVVGLGSVRSFPSGGPFGADRHGLGSHLKEIGRFNPTYVEAFLQVLMHTSAMPRLGLILLSSAMAERQYVVEGGDKGEEDWHQNWVDHLLPQITKFAANAIWFGWQPIILDWGIVDDDQLVPVRANDLDPFVAEALEDEETAAFAGISVNGKDYGPERGVKLTWQGWNNNHYGIAQALTVYPYWWAHSAMLVWAMRYFERSVDPVRVGFAQNITIPTGRVVNGKAEYVDLTEMVADAVDALSGGDTATFPMAEGDNPELVKLQTLDMPDRADQWLKMLSYLESKMLLSTLTMPGIGVSSGAGSVEKQDAKTSERTQIRVLEHTTEMVVELLNDLVYQVHVINRRPGLPPRVRGTSFKRDQEEKMAGMFRDAMMVPTVNAAGETYRPIDFVKWDKVAKGLNLPTDDVSEIAGAWAELMVGAPTDKGGRPPENSINPEIPSGDESGHESRPEERLDGVDRNESKFAKMLGRAIEGVIKNLGGRYGEAA
jgi:hypothetical protein